MSAPAGPRVAECRYQGEPGVRLSAGDLEATFLPSVGMTGVSLKHRDCEYLAVPGGVPALRRGSTGGLPLLAPWANRLGSRHYRAAGADVDLSALAVPTDDNGLPIHGLLVGQPGWVVDTCRPLRSTAVLEASIQVEADAFPFPHRLHVGVSLRANRLDVVTTLVPTGRRRVPVAFGWHPYLRLEGVPRSQWILRLPRRRHLHLDERGIPTGGDTLKSAESAPIGRRRFDDLFGLGRNRRLAFEAAESAVELTCGVGYKNAQVWVPPGRHFGALEPMVAPTNALVDGTAPLVAPGEEYRARFALTIT